MQATLRLLLLQLVLSLPLLLLRDELLLNGREGKVGRGYLLLRRSEELLERGLLLLLLLLMLRSQQKLG